MPPAGDPARRTSISYAVPRNRRVARNPGHAAGSAGSTRSPSCSGRMPRIHWLIATKFQAAVPVSHEFFASPSVGASRPAIIWAYTYGSQRWTSEIASRAEGLIRR